MIACTAAWVHGCHCRCHHSAVSSQRWLQLLTAPCWMRHAGAVSLAGMQHHACAVPSREYIALDMPVSELHLADMPPAPLQEYIALDMPAALQEAGFGKPLQASNTPRHKTVVAVKR